MFETDFPYVVEPMRWSDVSQVMTIEHESFPLPWPERAYRYELSQNKSSYYVVLRPRPVPTSTGWRAYLKRLWPRGPRPPLIGYGGFWMVAGEAHISTLAVTPAWRRRGMGELLLWNMLKRAFVMNACESMLEVRASNLAAQKLYQKYGFEKTGRHSRYYQDNGEDAWIMTVTDFDSNAYQNRLNRLVQSLLQRLDPKKHAVSVSGQSEFVRL